MIKIEKIDSFAKNREYPPTPPQWQAISITGADILVAAAAGSGKTEVLSERIARKVACDRWDIDKMLVLTFTTAAAKNMLVRIENKITDKNEILKKSQEFIDENKEYFSIESEAEYRKRIEEDFSENKKIIEKNLGNEVKFFCWPWGHISKETIEVLKELGVVGFISTKKGTNSMKANWNMIRRIELRNYNVKKFKINLLIARNLILGKIYGWIS